MLSGAGGRFQRVAPGRRGRRSAGAGIAAPRAWESAQGRAGWPTCSSPWQLSPSLRHSAEMGENRVRDGETTRERPDTTRRHPRVRLWTRQELITTLDRWRARRPAGWGRGDHLDAGAAGGGGAAAGDAAALAAAHLPALAVPAAGGAGAAAARSRGGDLRRRGLGRAGAVPDGRRAAARRAAAAMGVPLPGDQRAHLRARP